MSKLLCALPAVDNDTTEKPSLSELREAAKPQPRTQAGAVVQRITTGFNFISGVRVSAKGSTVLVLDTALAVVDAATGKKLLSVEDDNTLFSGCIAPDGAIFVANHEESAIHELDAKSGRKVMSFTLGLDQPDPNLAASSEHLVAACREHFIVIDRKSGKEIHTERRHPNRPGRSGCIRTGSSPSPSKWERSEYGTSPVAIG